MVVAQVNDGIKNVTVLALCCWRRLVAWPKSRTERPKKTKIGTEVAHVTCDSNTTFKVKRSKVKVTRPLCSPPCWRVRRLQRWAWERVGHGKLLLCCRLLGGARRFGTHGGGEGREHIVAAARLQLVNFDIYSFIFLQDDVNLMSFAGRSGLAVACLTAVREVLGSNRAVGSCVYRKSHCDLQP